MELDRDNNSNKTDLDMLSLDNGFWLLRGEKKSDACTGAGSTTAYTILWLKDKFPYNASKLPTLNPYIWDCSRKLYMFL